MQTKTDVVIIIPAFEPDANLIKLVDELEKRGYVNIIIVNDGSSSTKIFEQIKDKVVLLEHVKNYGKGRALKTGFDYCIKQTNKIIGVITADADGQHQIEDIEKVYETLMKNRESLILGSRNFLKKKIPLKSKMGNKISSYAMYKKTGVKLEDTQTGLRGIPSKYLRELLQIEGNRFEYETNMILYFIENKINIVEEKIECVYINENKNTNYKPMKDTIRIGKIILRRK